MKAWLGHQPVYDVDEATVSDIASKCILTYDAIVCTCQVYLVSIPCRQHHNASKP